MSKRNNKNKSQKRTDKKTLKIFGDMTLSNQSKFKDTDKSKGKKIISLEKLKSLCAEMPRPTTDTNSKIVKKRKYTYEYEKQIFKDFVDIHFNYNQENYNKEETQQLYEEFMNRYYKDFINEYRCSERKGMYMFYSQLFKEYIEQFFEEKGILIIVREDSKIENYINLLKEKEEELNNICRQKGFELTIVDKDNNFGEIHIKRLDNSYPTNFIIKIWVPFNIYHIEILNTHEDCIKQTTINDIPKWIYNYLNYDKVEFVCNFIGGEYDGQIMNREEIEKISKTTISKMNKLTFKKFITYLPILNNYRYMKRPKVDFGTIYYTYVESLNIK